jgi:hypothetical protein
VECICQFRKPLFRTLKAAAGERLLDFNNVAAKFIFFPFKTFLASSSERIFPLIHVPALVIASLPVRRRGRALRNPNQLRARPRLMLRPYYTPGRLILHCVIDYILQRPKLLW